MLAIFTASLVVQVGTEIVHFFTDSDAETGKRESIYAIGYISKLPKRGKRGSRWVMYEDGEFPHDLLEEHHGQIWSFIESNRDYFKQKAPPWIAPWIAPGFCTHDSIPTALPLGTEFDLHWHSFAEALTN